MAYNPQNSGEPGHGPTNTRGQSRDGGPHPVDAHVGLRLRQRRTLLGLTQEKLGDALGLTFQQVQKYERGTNRIGASRLFHLSQLLSIPVGYFFDDMPKDVTAGYASIDDDGSYSQAAMATPGLSEGTQARLDDDPMARKETMDLVRAYYSINDTGVRRRILDLARTLAKAADDD